MSLSHYTECNKHPFKGFLVRSYFLWSVGLLICTQELHLQKAEIGLVALQTQMRSGAPIFSRFFKQKLSAFIFNKLYLIYGRVLTYISVHIVEEYESDHTLWGIIKHPSYLYQLSLHRLTISYPGFV